MKKVSVAIIILLAYTHAFAQPCTTPFAKFGIAASSHCRGAVISFIAGD